MGLSCALMGSEKCCRNSGRSRCGMDSGDGEGLGAKDYASRNGSRSMAAVLPTTSTSWSLLYPAFRHDLLSAICQKGLVVKIMPP